MRNVWRRMEMDLIELQKELIESRKSKVTHWISDTVSNNVFLDVCLIIGEVATQPTKNAENQ